MTDTRKLAAKLAALKYLGDLVKSETDATKAALMESMDEGDRKTATLTVGGHVMDVGTVSRTKASHSSDVAIVDDDALIEWVKANGGDGIRTIEALADWKAAELLATARETGEMLPGMDVVSGSRPSYITVRLSPQQAANLDALRLSGVLTIRELTTGGE